MKFISKFNVLAILIILFAWGSTNAFAVIIDFDDFSERDNVAGINLGGVTLDEPEDTMPYIGAYTYFGDTRQLQEIFDNSGEFINLSILADGIARFIMDSEDFLHTDNSMFKVPEPTILGLVILGFAGLFFQRRKFK